MAVTAGIINGTDLCIYVGSTPVKIAYSQTAKLSLNMDMRDTTNKDTSGWKTVLPGLQSWTMETNGLVALDTAYNLAYLMNLVLNKTSVAVKFKTANASDFYFSGTAYLTSVSVESSNQANVTYSVSFVGTGALALTGSTPD